MQEETLNFGKEAELLKRLASVPLDTEDVRTLARAKRASDKSFPKNVGGWSLEPSGDRGGDGGRPGGDEEPGAEFADWDPSPSFCSSKGWRDSVGQTSKTTVFSLNKGLFKRNSAELLLLFYREVYKIMY